MEATGGIAPYTFAFDWYLEPSSAVKPIELFSSQSESTTSMGSAVLPTQSGQGLVQVTVRDNAGRSTVFSDSFSIKASDIHSGDANGDESFDIMDLVAIIDYIVSDTSPVSPANADANEDETVDILDLVWIIDEIVGI